MKILYIASTQIPSPAANSIHIVKMCQAFADSGHEVALLNLTSNNQSLALSQDIIHYYGVKASFPYFTLPHQRNTGRAGYLYSTVAIFPAVYRFVKNYAPDIVFGRYLPGCLAGAIAGCPTIFESHNLVWKGHLERFLFSVLIRNKNFRRLILITHALAEKYQIRYKCLVDSGRITVLPDAADQVTEHAPLPSWPGRADALQVGYVGHLYHGKGMEIIALLAPKMPEVDFHVIGGLERDVTEWKKRISCNNLFFHGFITPRLVSPYINALDLCLLPNQNSVASYSDSKRKTTRNIGEYTSPLKLFEYMAHRKPIIASDLPVLREILDESCSILVPSSDIDAWVSAINSMRDTKWRTTIGDAAYEKFLGNYTWQARAREALKGL